MFVDMPLSDLRRYRSEAIEPHDFDAFWEGSVSESRGRREPSWVLLDQTLPGLRVWDVTYGGWNGEPIEAWLIVPATAEAALPTIVEYSGYGGGRGLPSEWLFWPAAGFAVFVPDVRGQGGTWRASDTPDPSTYGSHFPGQVTAGIESRESYYYRRLVVDSALALEAVAEHPAVDETRMIAAGASQGGYLALASAALSSRPRGLLCGVPFLCDVENALRLTDSRPLGELSYFLSVNRESAETVLSVMKYFDGLHFSSRGRVPAYFSVGLQDDVCPPSSVFAAFNRYPAKKQIQVWPYNNHNAGSGAQEQLRMLSAARSMLNL